MKFLLSGFRSYRDETVIENLDPGSNVIVGRNGSGKSNLFFAIQFVLSDEFSNLSQHERLGLIHEGGGGRMQSAEVEVVFDNSDYRLPVDKDEVSVKRVIGPKKDQYYLDRKLVTKTDIMNLLEAAGFSRSNPYYIVKQGKITTLSTASETERLKLLREVAGTKVYDERKEESRKLLEETDGKLAKINELLDFIQGKIDTLEREQTELQQFQRLDDQRRALEYALYQNEVKEAKSNLDKLQKSRNEASVSANQLRDKLKDLKDKSDKLKSSLQENEEHSNDMIDDFEIETRDEQDVLSRYEQLGLKIADIETQQEARDRMRTTAESEQKKVKSEIAQLESEMKNLEPNATRLKGEVESLSAQLLKLEDRKRELKLKSVRTHQFRSREERDTWIHSQINSLSSGITQKTRQIEELEREMRSSDKDRESRKQHSESALDEINGLNDRIRSKRQQVETRKQDLDRLINERRNLQHTEHQSLQSITSGREEMRRLDDRLRSSIGRNVWNGYDQMKRLVERLRYQALQSDSSGEDRSHKQRIKHAVKSYHGAVIENLDTDPEHYVAVETIAANKLFTHIVDDEDAAKTLLEEYDREHLQGEPHFQAVNRIRDENIRYPTIANSQPLIEVVQCDEGPAKKVLKFIFDRVFLASDIDLAQQIADGVYGPKFDAITTEGDLIQNKGTMWGGYTDRRESKLELFNRMRALRTKLAEEEVRRTNASDALERMNSEIDKLSRGAKESELELSALVDSLEGLKRRQLQAHDEIGTYEKSHEAKERRIRELRQEVERLQATLERHRGELGKEMRSDLSSEDQQELASLENQIEQLRSRHKQIHDDADQKELELTQKRLRVQQFLRPRLDYIDSQMNESAAETLRSQVDQMRREHETLGKKLNEHNAKLEKHNKEISVLQKDRTRMEHELEDAQAKEKECSDKLEECAKEMERFTQKQSAMQKKRDEAAKKMREVGQPSQERVQEYASMPARQIMRKLEECKAELKRYANINQKAIDQYTSFKEQRDSLRDRRAELDRSRDSINDLLQTLEARKKEAIRGSFDTLAKNFAETFQKLVPTGKAELVMRLRARQEEESSQRSTQEAGDDDEFSGIGIRVSFVEGGGQMKEMQQLSGGQKCLVALALIFSIQMCDPAPFYLFDEIDAALDTQHRHAVARMIREMSTSAQYICTTFRPELIETTTKFFGVTYRNKVSYIREVGRDDARQFVESESAPSGGSSN